VSGVFTREAIACADDSFDVYGAALDAREGLAVEDRDRVYGVEVVENQVVG
jgi:hypothetical protein